MFIFFISICLQKTSPARITAGRAINNVYVVFVYILTHLSRRYCITYNTPGAFALRRSADSLIIKSFFITYKKRAPQFSCGTLLLYLLDNFFC